MQVPKMSTARRLEHSFSGALHLPLNGKSRYILFSDCHRGVGNGNDNFLKNEYLYLAALNYYYERGFTYLELGDGDELWENRSIAGIKEMHRHSFEMIDRFHQAGRLYAVYGNHDMVKKSGRFVKKYKSGYYCEKSFCERPLCSGIRFYPAIILEDQAGGTDVCLTHGHQADVWNSTFWRLSRFLVRYLWRPLEGIGVLDPTSAAKNNTKKKKTEKILTEWARENEKILITGHTHRPMAGGADSPYFNTGSCVHPGGITGIEIENRCITLVKWSMAAGENLQMKVVREPLGKTMCLGRLLCTRTPACEQLHLGRSQERVCMPSVDSSGLWEYNRENGHSE